MQAAERDAEDVVARLEIRHRTTHLDDRAGTVEPRVAGVTRIEVHYLKRSVALTWGNEFELVADWQKSLTEMNGVAKPPR